MKPSPVPAALRLLLLALAVAAPAGCAGEEDSEGLDRAPSAEPGSGEDPLGAFRALDPQAAGTLDIDLGEDASSGESGSDAPVASSDGQPTPHFEGDSGAISIRAGEPFVYRFEIVGWEAATDLEVSPLTGPAGATVTLDAARGSGEWAWSPEDRDVGHHTLQLALVAGSTREVLDALLLEIDVHPRESLVEYGF